MPETWRPVFRPFLPSLGLRDASGSRCIFCAQPFLLEPWFTWIMFTLESTTGFLEWESPGIMVFLIPGESDT